MKTFLAWLFPARLVVAARLVERETYACADEYRLHELRRIAVELRRLAEEDEG